MCAKAKPPRDRGGRFLQGAMLARLHTLRSDYPDGGLGRKELDQGQITILSRRENGERLLEHQRG